MMPEQSRRIEGGAEQQPVGTVSEDGQRRPDERGRAFFAGSGVSGDGAKRGGADEFDAMPGAESEYRQGVSAFGAGAGGAGSEGRGGGEADGGGQACRRAGGDDAAERDGDGAERTGGGGSGVE